MLPTDWHVLKTKTSISSAIATRVMSTNADTRTKAVKNQSTFRLCKSQQHFMRRVFLHGKQVTFESGFRCQNYEANCFLRIFPQENHKCRRSCFRKAKNFFKITYEKISFWCLSIKIHTSRCVLSPCLQNLVISWYCRLLYRCRHLSTWPYHSIERFCRRLRPAIISRIHYYTKYSPGLFDIFPRNTLISKQKSLIKDHLWRGGTEIALLQPHTRTLGDNLLMNITSVLCFIAICKNFIPTGYDIHDLAKYC